MHKEETGMNPLDSQLREESAPPAERCHFPQPKRVALLAGFFSGRQRAALSAMLTFLLLVTMTTAIWWNASDEVMRIAREQFAFKISETQFAIQQRLLAYEQVLRGGVGLFAASDNVTRDEWRTYVRTLSIDKNYPGIQGIGFSIRIPPTQRDEHMRRIRAEGLPAYTIWPPGERAEYTAIIYLEPFDWRNQRAIGYDMFSEPVRHDAMVRARDTGMPAASGKVKLVQETNQGVQHGFLMYLPVYQKNVPLQTAEQRRAALVGYVYSPFRMNDLMRGILGPDKLPDIHLEIFDGTTASLDSQFYDSLHDSAESQRKSSAFATEDQFEFDGRHWTLRFSSLPAFDATIDVQKPRLILFGGILVSALFAAVVWSLSLNRSRAKALAEANRGLEAEIAQRTKLAAELKEAKNVAEAANQAKSDFLTNVSHELRTPLTLILAPLEQLLGAQKTLSDWRAQIERVQRNAMLLLNRVNDILDFSKTEAGKLDVRWEAVDLTELVPTLAGDATAVAESKGCSLTWHVDPALDAVCLDRRHFEKILLNLVSNALKFTPPGGWIRLEAAPLDEAWFEFAVADSGIGVEPDKVPLLFKRFQQVDTSATRQYGGTGIGLALVKELSELMGGSAGVESEPGRGSRFFVRLHRGVDRIAALPVSADSAAVQARVQAEAALRRVRFQDGSYHAPSPANAVEELAGRDVTAPQVLVADDNPDMRSYIAELLRDECDVITAADGKQAWAVLQGHHIDVVVSDVMMPELDGLGLTARIKASPSLSHVHVILVTARGGAEASVSGLDTGADDYIAKPFSPQELQARVRSALRMSGLQMRLRDKFREAGMAMIATGILHNLGNVLTGVTVSSAIIQDKLRQSRMSKLHQVVLLLQDHADDLPAFLTRDSRGRVLPAFLAQLSKELQAEQIVLLKEVELLKDAAEHAAGVIASQQSIANPNREIRELISASALMETAIKLGRATFEIPGIKVERDYTYTADVAVDRNKAVQILMNLLSNARHAVRNAPHANKLVRVSTALIQDQVRLAISDNGVGIDPRHLPFIFDQGFTTKEDGHGFGLHSSANWARELGGVLTCHSDGPGRGATFTLELPALSLDDQRVNVESAVQAGAP